MSRVTLSSGIFPGVMYHVSMYDPSFNVIYTIAGMSSNGVDVSDVQVFNPISSKTNFLNLTSLQIQSPK